MQLDGKEGELGGVPRHGTFRKVVAVITEELDGSFHSCLSTLVL